MNFFHFVPVLDVVIFNFSKGNNLCFNFITILQAELYMLFILRIPKIRLYELHAWVLLDCHLFKVLSFTWGRNRFAFVTLCGVFQLQWRCNSSRSGQVRSGQWSFACYTTGTELHGTAQKLQRKPSHNLMFNNLFFETRTFHKIMWKSVIDPDSPKKKIWRMRVACWTPKATNTHSRNM
jgi:hypothetical protein